MVRDCGKGISPKENVDQVNKLLREPSPGSFGLGFFSEMASQIGGELSLDNDLNSGCTFQFVLKMEVVRVKKKLTTDYREK